MTAAVRSRVLKTRGAGGDVPRLVQLLRHCRELRDYSELLAYLRSISPSALDAQLRSMQVQHCAGEGRCMVTCLRVSVACLYARVFRSCVPCQ